ncbi:hypothetical protein M404DRAFT_997692 [Pisolithus tinctorius Marx 270]|uniref:Uncharacterized protein n=1 Tax=Pisolithus tinctorius Marx 270 TaxID=870435 RepID=A0A0C3PGL1_PISTI|nr:hypothetical protein M404DRAFT_997692 [Pisolithus tinctorius Marx 270]
MIDWHYMYVSKTLTIQRRVGGSRERARGTEENSVLFRSSAADTYIRDLSYIVHGEQYQRNTNPRT